MWTRSQLKEKGKRTFKANYWKAVLLALVLAVFAGGVGFSGGSGAAMSSSRAAHSDRGGIEYSTGQKTSDVDELTKLIKERGSIDATTESGDKVHISEEGVDVESSDGTSVRIDNSGIRVEDSTGVHEYSAGEIQRDVATFGAIAGITVLLLLLVAIALALAFDAFFANPIELGAKRFFLVNLNRKAEVKEAAFGFDHNYLAGVKTMFLRDIFTILWTLLFIIPGIVKSYEYRMIPYLLANDPTMTRREAFEQSKRMMTGNKWSTFVLDLSFLGWVILSALTLGIAAIFYVAPYSNMTNAALYERLCFGAAPGPDSSATGYGVHGATQIPVAPLAAEDIPTPVWDDDANGTA
jgi:hypothetical protein